MNKEFEISDNAGLYLISGLTMITVAVASTIAVSYCTGTIYDLIGVIGILGSVFVCVSILKNNKEHDRGENVNMEVKK